jgi:tetratricopeptide (TPR) repeat protein
MTSAREEYESAQARLHRGQLAEAEKHFRTALELDPSNCDILQGLGQVCVRSGQIDEAVNHLREAADRRPDSAAVYNNLAITLVAAKRFTESVDAYMRCIALEPTLPETYNDLGTVLLWLGRNEEAVAQFEKALTLRPDFVPAIGNLGEALGATGHHEQAAECFRRVMNAVPGHGMAHFNYGNAMMVLGHIAEARSAFELAIRLMPHDAAAHRALAATKTFTENDPQIAVLENLSKDETSLSDVNRIELHFALAKVYSDLGRHDRCFGHLAKGNDLRRGLFAYYEKEELAVLTEMAATFTSDLMEAKGGLGDTSDTPVFIIGMPRSGTTLVERVLAGHPDVFAGGELAAFGEVAVGGYAPKPLPFAVAELTGDDLRDIGARYIAKIRPRAPGAKRITDKLPANFRFAGLIRLALPSARIIHVRRNPADTCLSCFAQLFTNNMNYTYELGELGRYYKAYSSLMNHWRAVFPKGAMLEVNYEDLVGNFEPEARRLVEFCGLEWDGRCSRFYEATGAVQTASSVQVRRPIFQSSVGRWRLYKDHLGPLFEALDIKQDEIGS